ncbi:MAG: IS110 family transposase [Nitrososphaeraceae archaeon]|nr:IS110 family transposase [Nitrososphaeraceae archaeon]
MKKKEFYLGIDISKLWFDAALMAVIDHQKQALQCQRFDNNAEGLKLFDKWLKKQSVYFDQRTLIVIENTGVYHRPVVQYCNSKKLPIYVGNATDLKWKMGMVRGKSDQVDSRRLCEYAYKNSDELKATPPLDPAIMNLKDMMTARSKLLSHLNSIKVYLNELKIANTKHVQGVMEQAHLAALKGLKESLQQLEAQIKQAIQQNQAIKNNYDLLITVPGIGHLTAIYLICSTSNFAGHRTGKQLASYAGVVPFTERSGTSIKGRPRVHKMANKELKKMLHMGAMTAIKNYPEFEAYFERKKAQGKHPISILNAIRNKIALRAVAVVKNQKPYVDNYKKAA